MSKGFTPGQRDLDLFISGQNYESYGIFGARNTETDGVKGYAFTLWAPNVRSVAIAGDFNSWRDNQHHMEQVDGRGIWHLFIPGIKKGALYKYVIETNAGKKLYKADPYAIFAEKRPGTASRTWALDFDGWSDGQWMEERGQTSHFKKPLNIYEVHLGSWRRPTGPDGEPTGDSDFYTYRQLADMMVPYVKDMGYTHVEIMPVSEHPFDGSWGYQTTGYFAPTSRYGTPQDFMYMVNSFHRAGIGVILDWVPAHFCRDAHGLGMFNGDKLYESFDHKHWGTYTFDYGRPEVRSFLISNAIYWLKEYHIDGLRVDGVSSMLYLNFGVEDSDEKRYNKYGEEGNLEAIDFIRTMNAAVGEAYPGVFTIAEESTAWPLVTYPPADDGLGFHYKWDMGWMNDTLHYCQTDFPYRTKNHGMLTFSMMYAFSENYILPLSHDEVVHGKCSLMGRQPGNYLQRFAGVRLLAMYQMTHPGGKLNFMGSEIGEFIEWRFYEQLEWFLLDFEQHRKHRNFIKALNHMFLEHPGLWAENYDWKGYEWIDADNRGQSILSYVRKGGGEELVVILNFKPESYVGFEVGAPGPGKYVQVLASSDEAFGGSGAVNKKPVKAAEKPMHGQEHSIKFDLPALSGVIFKREPGEKKSVKIKAGGVLKALKKERAAEIK